MSAMQAGLTLVREAFEYATEVCPTAYTFTLNMLSGRTHTGAPEGSFDTVRDTGVLVFPDGYAVRVDAIESIQVDDLERVGP